MSINIYLAMFVSPFVRYDPEDVATGDAMVKMWVDFATTGDPTPETGLWKREGPE